MARAAGHSDHAPWGLAKGWLCAVDPNDTGTNLGGHSLTTRLVAEDCARTPCVHQHGERGSPCKYNLL